ncbi:efflux transporter outer membrane subunit [Robbsia sp. Bb-Pol-6]|uniref:Efflux transporter outer membrane subunit n=1 Tax=Robbsia betulipollinis TaxID=2981849 RepID=A0ABT3ZIZ9_9BURK|nr:efflux transporter outer membrane subunit [Robbsia betulipollinis]MCY0386407.1 efflux transporter outer membrane subunit [Robbsia betulipollinis]
MNPPSLSFRARARLSRSAGALLLATAGLASLAGCANYAGIRSDKQPLDVARIDTAQSLPTQGGQWPTMNWAADFGDTQLSSLIAEALANNPSIAEARARLDRAAAYAAGADARRYPRVDGHYSVKRELYSGNALYPEPYGGSWYTENNASLSASYELDLWGKNSAGLAQAISEQRASAAEEQESRLALATSVAQQYNALAREYALFDVAQAEARERQALGQISAARFSAGLDTQVETRVSDTQIATSNTLVSQLQGSITVMRYQLGALLGKGPDRGLAIARPQMQPLPVSALPDNVPANLLSRRPDIVAARWRIDAATQGVTIGKADFYPDINLSAAAGFDAFGFGHFLQFGSRQIQVGPAIDLPIFDAGALRARLKDRYATFDTAVATYNDTLVRALTEVATQIAQIRSIEQQQHDAQAAYDAAAKAYQLAVIRYQGGLSTQLQVLDADRALLQQRQTLVTLASQRRDQQIGLIKALGGGFDSAPPPRRDALDAMTSPT